MSPRPSRVSLAILALLPCGPAGARPGTSATYVVAAPKAPRPSSPEAALAKGKLAYERGDYQAAIAALRPLLYPTITLPDEEQVLLAHKLLGLSYLLLRDTAAAEAEFTLLLSLRPDFALDPVVEPVSAVAFVDALRSRNQERLEEVRRRQAEEEKQRKAEQEEEARQKEAQRRRDAPRIYVEKVVYRRFSALSLVPLGVPQLREGRRRLGVILAVGEAATGAASLSTWLTVRLRYPDGTFPPGELARAQALTITYLTTGAVFWGMVAWGLVDALYHARTVTTVRELPPQKRQAAIMPLLMPLTTPSAPAQVDLGLGLGLGGRF